MEVRLLRYFVAVAEEESFSRAARRLRIAQPSLSQQIRALERELGGALFDRSARPVRLTAAGARLARDAPRLLGELEATARGVRAAARGRTGTLRLGYINGGLYDTVLNLVRRFRAVRPQAELLVRELASADQLRALRDRRVDAVLARTPGSPSDFGDGELGEVEPGVHVHPLGEERMIALLPSDSPPSDSLPGNGVSGDRSAPDADAGPATAEEVALGALADRPFVMLPRRLEPAVFDTYLRACAAAGFTPRIDYEVTDVQTQALHVAAGLAVAVSGDGLSQRFPAVTYTPITPAVPVARFAALWLPEATNPLLPVLARLLPVPATNPLEDPRR